MSSSLGPRNPRDPNSGLSSLVRLESLIQLAIMIPAATAIGWLAGTGLDHLFHTTWISIAGLLLGAAAAFVQIFRIVLKAEP